ncbi:MAG: peptide deformylase [Clostridia bacterium]|nr:peptide deformylase [Clostridia bacterium]
MVRPVIRDTFLLSQKSAPATPDDLDAVRDLIDTLDANRDRCVGMAANMIGVLRRIIAVMDGEKILVMLNPEIVKASGPYHTEEGCLSLDGTRPTRRYRSIKVRWQDETFRVRIRTFEGFTAEIIQHEMDHLEGVVI